jgi:hypothetical protein
MKKKETKKISIDVPIETLKKLDTLAEMADIPRQKLITNILAVDADTLMDCKKVGILHLTLLLRDMAVSMQKWSKKIREQKSLNGFELKP